MNGIHSHKPIDGHDRILHKECARDEQLAMEKNSARFDCKYDEA